MALPKFAQNTVNAAIAGASVAAGNFLALVVVARALGAEGAGTVALAIWIAGLAVTLGDLGLPMTLARFMPDLSARGADRAARAFPAAFFAPVLATTALGAVFCATLYLLHDRLGGARLMPFRDQPSVVWVGVGVLFAVQAIGNYGAAALRGAQRFDLAARLAVASFLIQIAGVAVGGTMFGPVGALIGYGAAALLPALYALARIRPQRAVRPGDAGALDPDLRRRAWSFAAASWGVGLIAAIVWSRTELVFLEMFRGAREAGLYSAANTLALAATQGPLLMTGGMLAHFAEQWARGDRAKLQESFAASVRFTAFLLFPACLGMAAIAPTLVPALFGPAFAEAATPTALLVSAQAFGAVSTVSSALLFAIERNRVLVRFGVIAALTLILCGLLLVPAYGVLGAVGSRVAIQLALVAATFLYLSRSIGFWSPWGSLARMTVAALGCAVVARGVTLVAPGGVGLALAIVAGAAAYVALTRLLRPFPPADRARILALIEHLPRRARPLARAVFR